jgi:hypothetical protein
MSKLIVAALYSIFAVSLAFAQAPAAPAHAVPAAPTAMPAVPAPTSMATGCEAKAVNKSGKPLTGAAKSSSIKKCEAEGKGSAAAESGCEAKAVSKSGKPLTGAAKTSFIKKCEAEAKPGK